MKNWKGLRLIGAGGMSMLTVLFIVIWQAVAKQTNTLNQVMERLSELEQKPQTSSSRLLGEQLHSLQIRLNNQGERLNALIEQQRQITKPQQESIHSQSDPWQMQPEPPATPSAPGLSPQP
ncbi:hypothetical protein PMIT1342_00254 [Prochlorococcus marinus str. MIT 1342]|uniref:hypothetical protein n=1 Tax=Prochlorococcus TaxID=1218 RepID=UPI0007B351CD|nr:hypothetical protein [Prochlorococcus marinus]KZR83725.1 hypothetical protein PMIT1342_00254 [Prochlorococcus marinus str. MIT 1342]